MTSEPILSDRHHKLIVFLGTPIGVLFGLGLYLSLFGCAHKAAPTPTGPTYDVQPPAAMLATDNVLITFEQNQFQMHPGQMIDIKSWAACPTNPTTANIGVSDGPGTRVRVTYPGLAQPLYGVLAFCQLVHGYAGAAARSYRVEVPQSYVDATNGGLMSVVYEKYTVANVDYAAWLLWLSREPIPAAAAPAASPAK
jgi:hypothetical protein